MVAAPVTWLRNAHLAIWKHLPLLGLGLPGKDQRRRLLAHVDCFRVADGPDGGRLQAAAVSARGTLHHLRTANPNSGQLGGPQYKHLLSAERGPAIANNIFADLNILLGG